MRTPRGRPVQRFGDRAILAPTELATRTTVCAFDRRTFRMGTDLRAGSRATWYLPNVPAAPLPDTVQADDYRSTAHISVSR